MGIFTMTNKVNAVVKSWKLCQIWSEMGNVIHQLRAQGTVSCRRLIYAKIKKALSSGHIAP